MVEDAPDNMRPFSETSDSELSLLAQSEVSPGVIPPLMVESGVLFIVARLISRLNNEPGPDPDGGTLSPLVA